MALIVCSRGCFVEIDRQGGREGGIECVAHYATVHCTVLARVFVEGEGGSLLGEWREKGEEGKGGFDGILWWS